MSNFFLAHFDSILGFTKDIILSAVVVLAVKYLDYRKDKDKNKSEVESRLIDAELNERRDFKAEMESVKQEARDREEKYELQFKELQKQIDDWREKYYKLFEKYTELVTLNSDLKSKYHELMGKVDQIRTDNNK